MLEGKPLTKTLLIAAGVYLAYRYWATYPNLTPNRYAVRSIGRAAHRRGITVGDAYMEWADRKLRRTKFYKLARNSNRPNNLR
jgi:hypothetical protein